MAEVVTTDVSYLAPRFLFLETRRQRKQTQGFQNTIRNRIEILLVIEPKSLTLPWRAPNLL